MSSKTIVFLFITFLLTPYLNAQTALESLVKEGIELHNKGDFDGAIAKYEEALKIDKKSDLVFYEIAYAYFAKQDLESAIKFSDKALKQKGDYAKSAYNIKGSALDNLGKPEEAVKVYKKAIEDFPDDYLLQYNLALTTYGLSDLITSEAALKQALELNVGHSSSHLLLGYVMKDQGKRAQSLLPLYFFLLLEPNSERAKGAYQTLRGLLVKGVSQTDDKNIAININESLLGDEFSAIEMMLSLKAASNLREEQSELSEIEKFITHSDSFFSILGETRAEKTGIWWDVYADFFFSIVEAGHLKAYCYYISEVSEDPKVNLWIDKNGDSLDAFFKWANQE